MTLPPVKCECGEGIYQESSRVTGWWHELFRFDGSEPEHDDTGMRHGPRPRTVVCCGCGKRYLNPRYVTHHNMEDA